MLTAAVASGVTATFGAPIGGVLFSIEVSSTYYMVSNLWKAFFCSWWAIWTFKILSVVGNVELFSPTRLITLQLDYQYFAYMLLGVLSGFVGSLFIKLVSFLLELRIRKKIKYLSNRWIICLSVGLIAALTSFPNDFLRLPERKILQEMFSQESLETKERAHWNEPNIFLNLALFTVLKFSLTALSISLPIPAGVFTPTFVLGAVFGRLYGFALKALFGEVINETAYSIIGAAWVTSSVTRTISVAMIVFEINAELSYMIPVLLGVLLSYAISNSLWVSIFDVLLDMKDLPYLPAIRNNENYALKAGNMMNTSFQPLYHNCKLSDIAQLLHSLQHLGLARTKSIPVLKSENSPVLLHSVELQSLRNFLCEYYEMNSHNFHGQIKEELNSYFYQLNSMAQSEKAPNDEIYNRIFQNFSLRGEDKEEGSEGSSREIELEGDREGLQEFWDTRVDWKHDSIDVDLAPFTLLEQTPLAKVHFLFTMLNVSQIFVINEGILVGIITKREFLKRRDHDIDHEQNQLMPVKMEHLNDEINRNSSSTTLGG